MLSLATDADAARFRDEQTAFFTEAGLAFRAPTLARLRERFKEPTVIAVVDDAGVCEVRADERNREFQVELLLPQGADRALLAPLLSAAFVEAALRFRDGLDWRVWAVFMAGKDERGEPDAGEGECKAWAAVFDADVNEQDGGWWIESTLRRLLAGRVVVR